MQDFASYFPPFFIKVLFLLRIPLKWFLPARKFVALPFVSEVWQSDESFAEQRLSGMNPMMIRGLKEDDARVSVLRRAAIPAERVDSLLKQGAALCHIIHVT
jgi:hypothetical protein